MSEAEKVVVHAGLPAAGKSTAARADAQRLGALLVDKDEANPLERELAAAACGDPNDRDGQAYCLIVYPVTYSLVGELVCGGLRAGLPVVVDVPLLSEAAEAVAAGTGLGELLAQQWGLDRVPEVIWHEVDEQVQRERMLARGAVRDEAKLADWPAYQERLAQQVPSRRAIRGVVDILVDGHGQEM